MIWTMFSGMWKAFRSSEITGNKLTIKTAVMVLLKGRLVLLNGAALSSGIIYIWCGTQDKPRKMDIKLFIMLMVEREL